MSNAYEDPEKLARARWRGGRKHSYSEMAEELGCSVGTISLRMNRYESELKQYSPSDFEDLPVSPVLDIEESPHPLEFDFPSPLPTHTDEGFKLDYLIRDARWGDKQATHTLDQMLRKKFDTTFEDCIVSSE